MSVLAQGTQLFFIDPADGTVTEIECATAFSPGGNPADQLDDTCLADTDARSKPGLRRPGQAAMPLNADPRYPSHVRLFELSQDNSQTDIQFIVGWSDGIGVVPVSEQDSNGDWDWDDLPDTRTWYKFAGYVADFPFDFALNTLVTSAVSIQRSGPSQWIPRTAT